MSAPKFKFIATLPAGQWEFLLVKIAGETDAIVVVDRTAKNSPRMLIDDKLIEFPPT